MACDGGQERYHKSSIFNRQYSIKKVVKYYQLYKAQMADEKNIWNVVG